MIHKGGIIGFGGMGSWHQEHAQETQVNYVAVYDVDPERLAVAREKGMKAYETLEAFLADDSFDVVLVATPNNFHHDMVVAALEGPGSVLRVDAVDVAPWAVGLEKGAGPLPEGARFHSALPNTPERP